MKRPPGLWILLSAGILWLSLKNAAGIRATSLIFSKSTSTTTEAPAEEATAVATDEEAATEPSPENSNTTKPTLTGIPQVDYIYDPNLPQELNGYNLSDYPFYERVPEDIDFKCDGLHDGFYASVPHKCQVYHHCLFGTRYDFLCANYTAFDQKTFICHFVSEVDCVNSKKFWHRNDALYKAQSTTTIKPQIIYTPPPQPHPVAGPAASVPLPRTNGGPHRRPVRKRRPYDYYEYDEYDDYYEERPKPRRRKRPRPRRPIYDDEYEEYEDDRYEKRGTGRREGDYKGRPYDRRGDRRRNKDRRPYDDEPEEYDSIDVSEDRRRNPDDDLRRPIDRRKPHHKRRPIDDDYDRFERPRKGLRRPVYDDDFEDDYEEDPPQATRRSSEKPRRGDNGESQEKERDNKPTIKPTSGSSIYDRPRTAPKIKPPVPKNEANKYAYKTVTTEAPLKDEEGEIEYYDDYEDEPPKSVRRPETSSYINNKYGSPRDEVSTRKASPSRHSTHSIKKPDYMDDDTDRLRRNRNKGYRHRLRNGERNSSKRRRPLPDEEYYDEYEDDSKDNKYKDRSNKGVSNSHRNDDNKKEYESTSEEAITEKDESSSRPLDKYPEKEFPEKSRKEGTQEEEEPVSKEGPVNVRDRVFPKYENTPKRQKVTPDENASTDERNNGSNGGSVSNRDNNKPNGKERVYNRNKYTNFRERMSTTTPSPVIPSTSTEPLPRERPEHIVRIVKRPFLPSRGGNPYFARGLQAVGIKATEKPEISTTEEVNTNEESSSGNLSKNRSKSIPESIQDEIDDEEYSDEPTEKPLKPNPVIVKVPVRKTPVNKVEQGDPMPFTSRPLTPFRPYNNAREYENQKTTQEPEIEQPSPEQRNPLDINENEYDVTLNDALNPTLPNLPVRGFPAGFSPATDYTYNNFQRPRYVVDPLLTPANSDVVYQHKAPPSQRYEPLVQNFANTNKDYKAQYSTVNSQISQPNFHPRAIQQTQTQAFYSRY